MVGIALGEISAGLARGRRRKRKKGIQDERLEREEESHELEMERGRTGVDRTRQQVRQSKEKFGEWKEGADSRKKKRKASTREAKAAARAAEQESELNEYRMRNREREDRISEIMQKANEQSAQAQSEEQLKEIKRNAVRAAREFEFEAERDMFRVFQTRGGKAAAQLLNEFKGNGIDDAHDIVEDKMDGETVLRVVDVNGHPVIDPDTDTPMVFNKEHINYLYEGQGDFEVKETASGELLLIDRNRGTITPTGYKASSGKANIPGVGALDMKDAIALWYKETGGKMGGLEGERPDFETWLKQKQGKEASGADGDGGDGVKVEPQGEPPVEGAFWARNPSTGGWGWYVRRSGKVYAVGPSQKGAQEGAQDATQKTGDATQKEGAGGETKPGEREAGTGQAAQPEKPKRQKPLSQRSQAEKEAAAEKAKGFSLVEHFKQKREKYGEDVERAKEGALAEVAELDSVNAVNRYRKKKLKELPPEARADVWRALAKRKIELREE